MEKFTKILENQETKRNFKINATVELIINAENEGEAGYMADSILSSIENTSSYFIDLISEADIEE